MILLPAIDLMSGEVVRLRQGKAEQKTVYSRDPAAFAQRWEQEGAAASWLGFPTTNVQTIAKGQRCTFEAGACSLIFVAAHLRHS